MTSRSFGCDPPPGLRLMTNTCSTSGWFRHWSRTPSPTMPVAPVMIALICAPLALPRISALHSVPQVPARQAGRAGGWNRATRAGCSGPEAAPRDMICLTAYQFLLQYIKDTSDRLEPASEYTFSQRCWALTFGVSLPRALLVKPPGG